MSDIVDTFDVSVTAANFILYSVLCVFTFLALGAGGLFDNYLPPGLISFLFLKHNNINDVNDNNNNNNNNSGSGSSSSNVQTAVKVDYFLSARNSAGVAALGLSYFASGMGAWVVYGTTEMGANPQLSWIGVLGYSSAAALPALLIGAWLGPMIRTVSPDKTFSAIDFGRERYGRVMQVVMGLISGFYMFIFIVAELTSISNIYMQLTNNTNKWFGIGVSLGLGIFTVLYTSIAGLPASIATDKFQGGMMALLVLLLTIAVLASPENAVSPSEFALASNWTIEGFQAAITLIIAVACAELFNQGTWQRVWAAQDIPTMRKGFALGSCMVFLLMLFFGIMGMIAYAKDPEAYDNFEKLAFLSFFDLLLPLSTGLHVITLLLVTALAASSVDTLQNGISCVFAHDLLQFGWNPTWMSRIVLILINIPAVYMASKKYNVISLFLVADLVCATAVFPVFMGLQKKDYMNGLIVAPTELGALLGCISGIISVLINGIINDADGSLFEYFWLQNGAICSLCGVKTMVTFIVTPLVTLIMMYVFSYLDVRVRGDRARQPLITIPFDTNHTTAAATTNGSDADVQKKMSDDEDDNDEDVEKKMNVDNNTGNVKMNVETIDSNDN